MRINIPSAFFQPAPSAAGSSGNGRDKPAQVLPKARQRAIQALSSERGRTVTESQADARPRASAASDSCEPARGLGGRSLVLVGLMGSGKSSIGRRLAERLGLPFVDSDGEIEQAAGCSISEIFERYGEAAFRDGERRVIERLLGDTPKVVATGGGAFMDPATRALIKARAVSIWLKADIDVLAERTSRRDHRPLLKGKDATAVLTELAAQRHPVYAQADITVASGRGPHEKVVEDILAALAAHRPPETGTGAPPNAAAPERLQVALAGRGYDIVIGAGVLDQAGA
ncbi:MAG: shikimate kinase, partial [Alphaproteobacteria bacterium]